MKRVDMLTHRGKQIILVDLSRLVPSQETEVLQTARKLIDSQPPKSALILTDATEATYNKDVAAAIKDFVKGNTPYVKASAIVGADGVRLVLLQTVIFITRREIKTFDTREAALDWLANH